MSRWSPVGARRGVLRPEPGKKVTVSTVPMLLNVQKSSWFTAASKPLLVALCRHTVLCDRLADQLSKLAPADKGFARVLRECAGPVLYGPSNLGGLPMFTAIQVVAPSLRVELSSAAVRNAGEMSAPLRRSRLLSTLDGMKTRLRPVCSSRMMRLPSGAGSM
jgi:hypothetical protein